MLSETETERYRLSNCPHILSIFQFDVFFFSFRFRRHVFFISYSSQSPISFDRSCELIEYIVHIVYTYMSAITISNSEEEKEAARCEIKSLKCETRPKRIRRIKIKKIVRRCDQHSYTQLSHIAATASIVLVHNVIVKCHQPNRSHCPTQKQESTDLILFDLNCERYSFVSFILFSFIRLRYDGN